MLGCSIGLLVKHDLYKTLLISDVRLLSRVLFGYLVFKCTPFLREDANSERVSERERGKEERGINRGGEYLYLSFCSCGWRVFLPLKCI